MYVNGQSGRRYLQRHFQVPDERLFYSPYTTDVSSFAAVPLARDDTQNRRLLYAGQLTERKGILPFFETFGRWASGGQPARQL